MAALKRSAQTVVQAARSDKKITTQALLAGLFPDLMELFGDRLSGDDPALRGGIATFGHQPVTVLSTDKGPDLESKIATHFGSPTPTGYRKALRLMEQAAKFNRPIISLINTPGAYPGQSAEEQGQGAAIAADLLKASQLPVPMISLIFGEGGSGGALALACGDRVWMLQNSFYAILSPEGFASILWKDAKKSGQAAKVMQLLPEQLLAQGIIEKIVPEKQPAALIETLREQLLAEIARLQQLAPTELLAQRQARFRKF